MRRGTLPLLLVTTLATATTASALTRYVAPAGSDAANDCSVFGSPCATIAHAVDEAAPGDDIELAAGTYSEASIHVDVAVEIHGDGIGSTIIDSTSSVAMYIDTDGVVVRDLTFTNDTQGVRFEMAGGTIADTEIRDVEFVNNSSRGIEIHNATTVSDLRVVDCVFDSVRIGIRSASSGIMDGVSVTGSTFRNNQLGFYQANDGGTGYAINVTIDDCRFEGHSDTPIFAEELAGWTIENCTFDGNTRGFTIFKFYNNAAIDTDDITVRNNIFRNMSNTAVILYVLSSPATNILLEGNTIETDVSLVTANWSQLDIRLNDAFTNGPVDVLNNSITLSGSYAAGATAVHAIKPRGDAGSLRIEGNILDGGGVGDGGGVPPTSGIFFQTSDSTFGSMASGNIANIQCNEITGFVNGLSFYDGALFEYGNLPAGAEVNVTQNSIAGNDAFGLRSGPAGEQSNAINNWWGDPSGPGPGGSGDDVDGNADADPFFIVPVDRDSCPALLPTVDLRPNNTHNQVNTGSRQLVPIAILGTADFDPCTEIDPDSVLVRSATVRKNSCKDVNGDGYLDFVLSFRSREFDAPTEAECSDPNATITISGSSFIGEPFFGVDFVTWLNCG